MNRRGHITFPKSGNARPCLPMSVNRRQYAGRNSHARTENRGFVLSAVLFAITLLAAVAFVLAYQGVSQTGIASGELERDRLRYAAEAGLAHARLELSQHFSCSGYTDIPTTSFGADSYSATISPLSGSPVSVTAIGQSADGIEHTLAVADAKAYQSPVTIVLQLSVDAGKDTFLDDNVPDRNFGGASYIQVEQNGDMRPLLQFDLSAISANATIRSARLELRQTRLDTAGAVAVHRMTGDWIEGTGNSGGTADGATWETHDASSPWQQPGGEFSSAIYALSNVVNGTTWAAWDVTTLVQEWVSKTVPNYGIVLIGDSQIARAEFASRETNNPPDAPKLTISYACECGVVCTAGGSFNTITLSTDSAAILGGLSFTDKDLVEYDPATDTASLLFDGSLTTLNVDITALHVLANGHLILAGKGNPDVTLGGLTFQAGDLIDYDPVADTATLIFDGDALFTDPLEKINAVHLLDNGHLVLATDSAAILGGLSFTDKDLVEYDPATDTASLFFDGSLTTLNVDITALHVLANGHLILAGKGNPDVTLGGLIFQAGDLVDYDPVADTATLIFDGDALFTDPLEIFTSIHVGPGSGGGSYYLDKFNAIAYDGNDGTLDWTAGWQEGGESDGPTAGKVMVVGNRLRVWGKSGGGESLTREADLSSATTATLTFSYQRAVVVSVGSVTLQVSDNGGGSWTNLTTYNLSADDPGPVLENIDITPYIAANTQIRFLSNGGEDGQYIYFDDVQISIEVGSGGPTAHWKLDDGTGTTAIDSEGGHDGTLSNGPVWVAGQLGNALQFDGADDYVDLTSDAELDDVFAGGATVMAWIEPAGWGGSGYGRIFDKSSSPSSTGDGWAIRLNTDNGGLNFGQGFTSGRGWWRFAESSISLGSWQHIAIAYDASSTANDPVVYLDGSPVPVARVDTPWGTLRTDAAINLRLGGHASATAQNVFNGKIDDARIYDRMLDAAQIAEIAAGGGGGGGGGGGSCDGNFRDEFNVQNYSQNDGTLSWATDWLEINESDGPAAGDEQVKQSALQVQASDGGGEGAQREADLTGAGSATLTFDYKRKGLDNLNDYVTIDISANGDAGPWVELDRFEGPANDSSYLPVSYDISAYVSNNTRIRFLTSSKLAGNENVSFDNVEIVCGP